VRYAAISVFHIQYFYADWFSWLWFTLGLHIWFLTFLEPWIVVYFYSKTNYMHQSLKFILFWNDTLHVSDGLSVHHQEFKTVQYIQQQVFVKQILPLLANLLASSDSICVIAVCTVLNTWWWRKIPSETCRVIPK